VLSKSRLAHQAKTEEEEEGTGGEEEREAKRAVAAH